MNHCFDIDYMTNFIPAAADATSAAAAVAAASTASYGTPICPAPVPLARLPAGLKIPPPKD